MDLLARREYSCRELSAKLLSKGYEQTLVADVLAALQAQRLLSDARFAESLDELIGEKLDFSSPDWLAELDRIRRKKFGDALPRGVAERARQTRFLLYRGFTLEQIRRTLNPRD